ncbi:golgin subfamily A member 2 [Sitodiplosis mosellana]|uniref:golgin subfamily A member 2 n=1 Tax=Sitodiplosis mosellana TaxID=263140 RepID=UPI002443DA52|nr:golgin subfamily A member 2 [Sitodiplosis mosellana]
MSDNSKAEKIAAARKKLKQFQSKAKVETTSNSTVTSCGTESSVNTNGNACIESIQNDAIAQIQAQIRPSPTPPPQQQQLQQINMHFGAIDPAPNIGSTKIFDQHSTAENLLGSQSEIALNMATAPVNNIANFPQPTQTSQNLQHLFGAPTNTVASLTQSTSHTEAFPQFTSFSQTSTFGQPPQQQPYYPPLSNAFNDVVQPNQESQVTQASQASVAAADFAQFEQRNQELANLLQVEKVRNHELSVKVSQQHSTIEELNRELEQFRQNGQTVQELQQQVNAYIQTVNILVGEKSDLTAKLQHKDQRLTEYESKCVELQGRLNASRHRVSELEKDLNTLAQSHQKYDGSQQVLCTELETLQEDSKRLKRLHLEACDENTEIQHQLALKTKEIDELKNVITAKNSELEMARVRLEQLTGGDLTQSNETLNTHPNQNDQQILDSERQLIELQNMISELTNDRDRTQQQYQTYVQHLTNETTTMTQRIQELTKANEKLTKREESLVNHVQELEKQIQKQLSTQRRLAALRDDDEKPKVDDANTQNDTTPQVKEELSTLREKLSAIEKEKTDLNALLEDHNTQKLTLQQHLLEKDAKLSEIESELERLRTERPDTSNILATIESDKVAASRAMAQNQELRKQLEEMQQAYVQVSNDKLELTSQLQSEVYLNRDVRNRFADLENELKSIKEKLHFKDEEMIRLTHENAQFDAKIQELTKRLDSNSNDGVNQFTELQKRLHAANKEIKKLRAKLQGAPSVATEGDDVPSNLGEGVAAAESEHLNEHEHEHGHENDHHGHEHSHDHSYSHGHSHSHDHSHNHSEHGGHCSHDHDDESKSVEALDNSDVVSVTSTINIATNEAMDKLQDRFKRTMNEIADLTEEKHRLEHLVTQLQSETETIGEYIALYQTQRRLLKQREIEKDIQLSRIAADREDMKDKLRQLNELVELLLVQKGFNNAKEIMAQLNTTNNNSEKVPEDAADAMAPVNSSTEEPVNGLTEEPATNESQHSISTTVNNCQHNNHDHDHPAKLDLHSHIQQSHHDTNTRETATKIINLLTDIKDKNLRQDYAVVPNSVDHCSCCSGKLEVV